MVMTGRSEGTVMRIACCHRFAPSIEAVSYRPGSMEESDAR